MRRGRQKSQLFSEKVTGETKIQSLPAVRDDPKKIIIISMSTTQTNEINIQQIIDKGSRHVQLSEYEPQIIDDGSELEQAIDPQCE